MGHGNGDSGNGNVEMGTGTIMKWKWGHGGNGDRDNKTPWKWVEMGTGTIKLRNVCSNVFLVFPALSPYGLNRNYQPFSLSNYLFQKVYLY
ncbi:MAG: hypothetical protein ACI9VM_000242 [Candidatus Azotimanducaceae bacterium]|jgi:hypothetical protein